MKWDLHNQFTNTGSANKSAVATPFACQERTSRYEEVLEAPPARQYLPAARANEAAEMTSLETQQRKQIVIPRASPQKFQARQSRDRGCKTYMPFQANV